MEFQFGFYHMHYAVDIRLPKEIQAQAVELKQKEMFAEVIACIPEGKPVVITKHKTEFIPAKANMMYCPTDTYILSIELREYK